MSKPDAYWMVWNPKGNMPRARHDCQKIAIAEAERIAALEPGTDILVLQVIGHAHVKPAPKTFTAYNTDTIPF